VTSNLWSRYNLLVVAYNLKIVSFTTGTFCMHVLQVNLLLSDLVFRSEILTDRKNETTCIVLPSQLALPRSFSVLLLRLGMVGFSRFSRISRLRFRVMASVRIRVSERTKRTGRRLVFVPYTHYAA